MKNIRLDLQYDGSPYHGWQRQPGAVTVQGELEKAIYEALGERVDLKAAGRTDAGVHAYQQVVNFRSNTQLGPSIVYHWINRHLPPSIEVKSSREVGEDFHSRYDAIRKTYLYKIYNSRDMHPIYRNYYGQVFKDLDLDLLVAGTRKFIGKHDFSAFSRGDNFKKVRDIDRIEVRRKGPIIEIEFEAEAFLWRQIRIIVGSLVYLAMGRIALGDIERIFKSKDRNEAGPAMPASGLYLMEIDY